MKDKKIEVRCSEEQKSEIKKLANKMHMSVSQYVIFKILVDNKEGVDNE